MHASVPIKHGGMLANRALLPQRDCAPDGLVMPVNV
jgi:hypothetical protein